ncbi:hypothetical protein QM294_10720 [Acinetobacter junii]|uniref:hypothetical protein n=1 Tax=Acinetobacter junii TaxID=40215 RepID=UPI0024B84121|nr:hypothetical protein [Acinetobacter junii]MDI9721264.1 hypothetical protein [Acinetobacter junii]
MVSIDTRINKYSNTDNSRSSVKRVGGKNNFRIKYLHSDFDADMVEALSSRLVVFAVEDTNTKSQGLFDQLRVVEAGIKEELVSLQTSVEVSLRHTLQRNWLDQINSNYTASPSYIDVYRKDFVWSKVELWIVQTKAKGSLIELAEYMNKLAIYEDDYRIKEFLDFINNLKILEFSQKSFINFLRYYPVLRDYLLDEHYSFTVINNLLRLHLWVDNLNLVLHFREDFILDFYSYDDDEKLPKERLIYNMSGTFSSSSTFRKSYKIERLMSILDEKILKYKREKTNGLQLLAEDYSSLCEVLTIKQKLRSG